MGEEYTGVIGPIYIAFTVEVEEDEDPEEIAMDYYTDYPHEFLWDDAEVQFE